MEPKTTSEKQIMANRQNAQKGGVKSEEGKAISKYNAVTHGVLRQSVTKYEKGMYQDMYADLLEKLRPVGVLEILLVERIAISYIRLFRAAKAESEFVNSELSFTPRLHDKSVSILDQTLLRYDTSIENKLYKALHHLEVMQNKRKKSE